MPWKLQSPTVIRLLHESRHRLCSRNGSHIMPGQAAKQFRTLFISDLHLGSWAAKADYLIDFLRHHEAETIYLVGDIVDGWRLRRSSHWPQAHNDVVQRCSDRRARARASPIWRAPTTSFCACSRAFTLAARRGLAALRARAIHAGAGRSSRGRSGLRGMPC